MTSINHLINLACKLVYLLNRARRCKFFHLDLERTKKNQQSPYFITRFRCNDKTIEKVVSDTEKIIYIFAVAQIFGQRLSAGIMSQASPSDLQ